jgi:hypothetical protein
MSPPDRITGESTTDPDSVATVVADPLEPDGTVSFRVAPSEPVQMSPAPSTAMGASTLDPTDALQAGVNAVSSVLNVYARTVALAVDVAA